ncbi:MAG: hypothetical protein HY831_00445, partial [Candidatus Aenigmarchaeota archaeon]|nr:hypothetical protein [Candidatus Aenigmarchaeota archaeon]
MSIANLWNNARTAVSTYVSKVAPAKYLATSELRTSKDEEIRNVRSDFLNAYQTALIEDQNFALQDAVRTTNALATQYDTGLTRYLKGEKIARTGNETTFETGFLDALESAYSEVRSLNNDYNSAVQTRAAEINISRREQSFLEEVLPIHNKRFNENHLQPKIDAFIQELTSQRKRVVTEIYGDNAGQLAAVYDSPEYRACVIEDMNRAVATAIDIRKKSTSGPEFEASLRAEIPDIFKKYADKDSELMARLTKTSVVALNYESQARKEASELASGNKSNIYKMPQPVTNIGRRVASIAVLTGMLFSNGCRELPITQTPTPNPRPTIYVSHAANNDVKVAESYKDGKRSEAS